MNHSCAPCCLGPDSSFEVAVRDIYPGEELTDDYAGLYLQDHESFHCRCGMPECRTWVSADDAAHRTPEWDRLLREALRSITRVPQSLAPILLDSVKHHRIAVPALHLLQPLLDRLRQESGVRSQESGVRSQESEVFHVPSTVCQVP
jgi:hypothetical protein